MKPYKQYKHKEYVRLGLYFIAVALIGYFFFDSYSICDEFTQKELLVDKSFKSGFDNKLLIETQTEINLNQTYGGLVWKIFINITQIIFLTMFILIIYINELIEKWSYKQ